jgi:hypothetical protein
MILVQCSHDAAGLSHLWHHLILERSHLEFALRYTPRQMPKHAGLLAQRL